MKIVILGAGAVGSTLANLLSQENDLTIVDNDGARLTKLEEEADIKTILGNASYPNILVNAGINDADMVVAVTASDEINLVSCMISKVLNDSVKTIARDFRINPQYRCLGEDFRHRGRGGGRGGRGSGCGGDGQGLRSG